MPAFFFVEVGEHIETKCTSITRIGLRSTCSTISTDSDRVAVGSSCLTLFVAVAVVSRIFHIARPAATLLRAFFTALDRDTCTDPHTSRNTLVHLLSADYRTAVHLRVAL